MHRIRVALVLLVATLLIAGCAAQMPDRAAAGGAAPSRMAAVCADPSGVRNPDAPIVCVDDSASVLKVSPDPFVLHETPSQGSGTPAVQWFTTSGRGDLNVVFQGDCVRNVVCTGGHCTAVAARLNAGERQRRCKYDVELTGHPTLDPEGVLQGCCVPPTP